MILIDDVTINNGLIWIDRNDYDAIQSQENHLQGGSLVIEEFERLAGRPITLEGYLSKANLDLLEAKKAAADTVYPFDYYGDQFNVRFRRGNGSSITATPRIKTLADPQNTYQGNTVYYNVTIKLIEV